MRKSLVTGLSFGLTSGVITTLGLLIGLAAGTNSKVAVIGGVLTIAIADAFSDALGIHISEESQNHGSTQSVWEATGATLGSKFLFAITFLIPVLLWDLSQAVVISIFWGAFLLVILSLLIARSRGEAGWKVVTEHLSIAVLVILMTHFVGQWIGQTFG